MRTIKLFYLICYGEVHYTGTEFQCRQFAKQKYKKFPKHVEFELVKHIERLENVRT